MCLEHFILCQNAINGPTMAGRYDVWGRGPENMICREVGANTVANFPSSDLVANCDNLAGHI